MRHLWLRLAGFQSDLDFHRPQEQLRGSADYWFTYEFCGRHLNPECDTMGQERTS